MSDTIDNLSSDIRTFVCAWCRVEESAIPRLAAGLDVPEATILRMLEKKRWDFKLAVQCADILDLALHVRLLHAPWERSHA